MNKVNATLNVLACLIISGEATDPLVEHLEMRGIVKDPRKLNLFDKEVGPNVFVETKAFLECGWDDLFLEQDIALKRIFNWVKASKGKDCELSCSMKADASLVAYKLHLALEDRSVLRVRMEFDMRDPRHPEYHKCDLRLRRSNTSYFIDSLKVEGKMRQAPTAFLQCIRECAEYADIENMAKTVLNEGFVGHVCGLPTRASAWEEEVYTEVDERGCAIERKVRLATYGNERYEYELNEKDEECMSLRCGKFFKCMYKRPAGTDYRLAEIVFKDQLVDGSDVSELKEPAKPASAKVKAATAAPKPANKPTIKPLPITTGLTKSANEAKKKRSVVELSKDDVLARVPDGGPESHAHPIERMTVSVEVKKSAYRSERREVTAYRCAKCGYYLISEAAYSMLKSGDCFVCSRVIELDASGRDRTFAKRSNGERYLAEESLLHSYGYNVSKKDNLTPAQRQMILEFVVKQGIMTPQRAMGFLQYLVDRAKSRRKADMSSAIHSWETDIRFLQGLARHNK